MLFTAAKGLASFETFFSFFLNSWKLPGCFFNSLNIAAFSSLDITPSFYNFVTRDRSRTAATSKMERFLIIVNGFQPLTIITKHSILDVAAVLDPPLTLLEMRNVIMWLVRKLQLVLKWFYLKWCFCARKYFPTKINVSEKPSFWKWK